MTLDEALKITNRRVNALEFVLIPKIQNIIAYIEQELDEEAREDFTRLKKVTENKKKEKAAGQKEADAKEEEALDKDILEIKDFVASDSDDDDVFVWSISI